MTKCFLVAVAIYSFLFAEAQNSFDVVFLSKTYTSDKQQLPFWFTSNQFGKVRTTGSFLNVSEINVIQRNKPASSTFNWSWGANIVAGFSRENYLQLNQAFAALSYKMWELKGGMFHDTLHFSGLSSTNGNIIRSTNARPVPMLRMSSAKNVPVPFTNGLLSFNAMYSEGLLNDNRFVNKARLHLKSFHLFFHPVRALAISLGFEHGVMWGGFSANSKIGKMPEDLKSYLRYISGSRGNHTFPETDKMNVAGNQLGIWQLEIEKRFTGTTATVYLNHPFEDFSGVNFRNLPDNLLGLHIHFKTGKLFNALLYEFTNTRHQSVRDSFMVWVEESGKWAINEFDNYFNHSLYQSGYTYQQQVIGSPLFFPVIIEKGISHGIKSNRFFAHHAGLTGDITSHLKWKGMVTYLKHFGTYPKSYKSPHRQISGLLELNYSDNDFPVKVGLSAAADSGILPGMNRGISLSISKSW